MKREKAAFDLAFARKKNVFGQTMERQAQEACVVLKEIGAWSRSYSIYFLHSIMCQGNGLVTFDKAISEKIVRMSAELGLIVMNWTPNKAFEPGTTIFRGPSPVPEHLSIKATLIARVVQERHAYNRYAREMMGEAMNYRHDLFYKTWLNALGITEEQFQYLTNVIDAVFQE